MSYIYTIAKKALFKQKNPLPAKEGRLFKRHSNRIQMKYGLKLKSATPE